MQSEVKWSRESSASGFPPPATTCARCGTAGPLTLEAAVLRGAPVLRPFARFCSSRCFRANWSQLRDLQAWASASASAGRGCADNVASRHVEPESRGEIEAGNVVAGPSVAQRIILGRGKSYIPTIADIGNTLIQLSSHRTPPVYS